MNLSYNTMSWRFFRRFFLFPWVSLNVGKRGWSTSIGPRGAKVTIGQRGIHATVGLPGTGLSMTQAVISGDGEPPAAPPRQPPPQSYVDAFRTYFLQCMETMKPDVTVAAVKTMLGYQHTLGLLDEDLPLGLRAAVERVRLKVMEADAAGRETLF